MQDPQYHDRTRDVGLLLCGVRSPRHAKTCLVVGAVQQSLSKGESLTSESAVPSAIMALIMLAFVVMLVKSLIGARRRKVR